MAQKLKFGNGTWATKEGSTLSYNDENNNYKPLPFTTTRDSIATRVNKEGLIEVVGNDVPRIDYTDSADGALLLEPSRINLVNYSKDFSSSWISSGTNPPVLTPLQFISPDGTQNASRLQTPITNTTSILQQLFSHTSGTQYTVSAYVKSNVSTNQQFKLYGDYGSPTGISAVLIATSEWQRFTFTYTATGTGSRSGGFYYVPNTESDIQIYGFQAEQGSYATSYIPTQGSTVQRQADTASGSGNSEVFNDSEGVLFSDIAALADDGTFRTISINGTATNVNTNRVQIYFRDTADIITFGMESGNSAQFFLQFPLDVKLNNKLALKYSASSCSFWINGIKVGEETNKIMPTDLIRLDFVRQDGNDEFFYGKTKELGYYDTALTDEELEYLTSYRSLNELVTELNLNTL